MFYLALELIRLLCGDCLRVEECVSSRFGGAGDKHRGGASPYLGRKVSSTDRGIAHRTLPLGTAVIVCNMTRKAGVLCAGGVVLDRGPYGAMHEGRWRIKRPCKPSDHECQRKNPGIWRGGADVAVGTPIEHDGWERVRVYSWRKRRR